MKHSNVPTGEKSVSLRNSIYTQESENRLPLWRFWRKSPRSGQIVAIAAVATLALSASPVSLAAAESSPSESATLIAALPAYTCPAGTVKLTPFSARRTAHGADVYHYAMKSGPGFDSYVPPAGFNPLAASNPALSEMNMPTRPVRGTAIPAWKKEMSGYKGTKKPELCEATTPLSTPASGHTPVSKEPGEIAGDAGSGNWAGYVDTAGRYTAVGAYWHQTTASNAGTSNEVTWVGIGGWNSKDLLQDGTDSPGNGGYPYSWWEYLGGKSVGVLSADRTYAGQTIEAQVYYSTASSGTAQFYVHDAGYAVLNERETDINQDYDPNVVDFVNERPKPSSGPYLPLSNTGTTDFWDANGQNPSGSVPVDSSGVIGVVMTSNGSYEKPSCSASAAELQYPNDLSGDTFESHFCRAS
jgi:hypothetical protein